MALSKYANIWRIPYEGYAALAWLAASGLTLVFYGIDDYTAMIIALIAAIAGIRRFFQAKRLIEQRVSLSGNAGIITMTRQELLNISSLDPDGMFLGLGWKWQPRHARLCRELFAKNDDEMPTVPKWMLKIFGHTRAPEETIGNPRIHGLETRDTNIYAMLEALAGHTLIVGTTGSGKTRLYEVLVTQAIAANAVVIFIDPKGDRDLELRMRDECKKSGRDFLFFHPAFPSKSIRFNPLKNWHSPSEIASRIAQLLGNGDNDNFVQFAHLTIDRVINGLLAIGERPSLRKIMEYVQIGVDPLLDKLLDQYLFEIFGSGWEGKLTGYLQDKKAGNVSRTDAKIALYTAEVRGANPNDVMDGLVSIYHHSKEHYNKMILALLPLLQQLTSGEIGEMLSPEHENMDDPRPIFDSEKIIKGGKVFYMATNSLSNKQVATAITSIALADFAAVAGSIYNFEDAKQDIYLMVDEAGEGINDQFTQILNKGRGAGYKTFFATQTLSDLEVRLGSKQKANQTIGNANNMISLRLQDTDTAKYIADKFGETTVRSISVSQSNRAESEANMMEFGGTVTRAMKEEQTELMPMNVLKRLPNLQFVALVAGGNLYKGRIPIITN
ncbi:MAG: conjugative transfer system coupling protein TraD [Pseudomonadota bacterium]|nr:conjugative transfer system coupling protein TraD [Pseudomonadota bacterium]